MRAIFRDELVGLYLHGSLAMGSFNPARSDIDLLAVVKYPTLSSVRFELARALLELSAVPAALEFSVILDKDLTYWKYPTPFEFHFGEDARASFLADLAVEEWINWPDADRFDPDLAGHAMVAKRRGRTLWGRAVDETFPDVPREHYLASIRQDFIWARARLNREPTLAHYLTLNCARTLRYLREDFVGSKIEGGRWALTRAPAEFRHAVAAALASNDGSDPSAPIEAEAVRAFCDHMLALIAQELETA